ncbi:hypothetical protein SKAU_G00413810 [Synaphobranchus kaupii]|uniref:Uncharacterized protein n=1 Tax=Synaphobranchus kaupii TaxID=118154 RepID=A0A9Q1I9F0_SYNKA|nr:hypothetical protein SKAU_G00413810 [Synaphobranchus kaupii]
MADKVTGESRVYIWKAGPEPISASNAQPTLPPPSRSNPRHVGNCSVAHNFPSYKATSLRRPPRPLEPKPGMAPQPNPQGTRDGGIESGSLVFGREFIQEMP